MYPCYLTCFRNQTDDHLNFQVSMTPVFIGATSIELEIAIISTTFTAIACVVLLILFIYFIFSDRQHPWSQSTHPSVFPHPLTTNTTDRQINSVARPLSREQIDTICNPHIFDHDDKKQNRKLGPHDVCSICLEDDDHGPETQLPCQHVFHTTCVRSWLMRGGVTCPLCCSQLAESFTHDEEQKREHISQQSNDHQAVDNNIDNHQQIVAIINNEQHVNTHSNLINHTSSTSL